MRNLRALSLAAALACPAVAGAAPVTYALDHGAMTLTVKVDGTAIASGAASLTSGSVTFDSVALTIPTFALGASGSVLAPLLPGDYDQLNLTSISLAPGTGYSSSGSGSNPTVVTLGPINVSFAGSVIDGTTPVTVPPIPFSGSLAVPSYTVNATLNTAFELGIGGMKLVSFNAGGHVIEVFSDIEFIGLAVPEPALGGLLAAAGLAGVAVRRRR